jgi:hypothetical protein
MTSPMSIGGQANIPARGCGTLRPRDTRPHCYATALLRPHEALVIAVKRTARGLVSLSSLSFEQVQFNDPGGLTGLFIAMRSSVAPHKCGLMCHEVYCKAVSPHRTDQRVFEVEELTYLYKQ